MCLTINDFKKDARVAGKSITVYKFLLKKDNNYLTPYMKSKVKIGETLKASEDKAPVFFNEISGQGVHAYKTLAAAKLEKITWTGGIGNACIAEWEIPAGTTYWEGIRGSQFEIAAKEMKFVREIEAEDFPICTLSRYIGVSATNKMAKFADFYYDKDYIIKPVENTTPKNVCGYIWTLEHLKKLLPESIKINGITHNFFYEEKKLVDRKDSFIAGYETVGGKKTISKSGPKILEADIFFHLLLEITFDTNNAYW